MRPPRIESTTVQLSNPHPTIDSKPTYVEWFSEQSSTDYVYMPSNQPALFLRALLGMLGSAFGKSTQFPIPSTIPCPLTSNALPHIAPETEQEAAAITALPACARAQLGTRVAFCLITFLSCSGRSPSPAPSASSLRTYSSASIDTAASAASATGSRAPSTRLSSVRSRVRQRDVTCVISDEYLSSKCTHIRANTLRTPSSPPNIAFLSLALKVAGPSRLLHLHYILGGTNLANINTPANCFLLSPGAYMIFDLARLAFLLCLHLNQYNHTTTRAYYVQVVYPAADRLTAPGMDVRAYLLPDLCRTYISRSSSTTVAAAIPAGALLRLSTLYPARLPLPHPLLLDLHHTLSYHDLMDRDSDDDDGEEGGAVRGNGMGRDGDDDDDDNGGGEDGEGERKAGPAPTEGKRSKIQALVTLFWKSIKAVGAGGGGAAAK
ncbi:hypothetical protein DFH27DRAFT_617411 [Peziza echinospora]|nr:hypothetical protein DFH27DRAFT_617411 [Peziza echinospora]